jgi:uncharacterized phage protein (TIGR02218 family)
MGPDLKSHLVTGVTTVCRTWAIASRGGITQGFTDHDRDLSFEGINFLAGSGLTAGALQQATGLAVDNTEAVGALSHEAIREEDILAGRYDGAEVRAWLVNWQDVQQRALIFRGTIGELTRAGGAFRAELRGLSEPLNQTRGRVYQRDCTAVLGDRACKVDLEQPGYYLDLPAEICEDRKRFRFAAFGGFDDRWFERGTLTVQTGPAAGLRAVIKNDRLTDGFRDIELWQPIGADVFVGDSLRLTAGCDRRQATCQLKFNNFMNFRGFPHIPGEDWLATFPSSNNVNEGGSLRP